MAERKPGFIRLYRRAMDEGDPFWNETPFGRWRARLDLIALASFADRDVSVSGHKVRLRRGELFASHSFLAVRWGWTRKQVRTFTARLQTMEFMTQTRKDRLGTVYRIANYDAYQSNASGGRKWEL